MAYKYKYKPRKKSVLKKKYSRMQLTVASIAIISVIAFFVMFVIPGDKSIQSMQTTTTMMVTTTLQTTTTLPVQISNGELVVALKDEPHKLPGGAVAVNVTITVGNITAHRVVDDVDGNETDESGEWVVVSIEPKTLDLLQFTDMIAIVGSNELEPGKYTKVRMEILEGNVTIENTYIGLYTGKDYPLVIPSSELKTARPFYVRSGETTVVTIDFDIENSIKRTADGYTLKPVIKVTDETIGWKQKPTNSTVIE